MRMVKWCLTFGVVLAGVVIGYCRPCHEADVAPLPTMWTSFDGGCCEDGCDCGRHGCDPNQAFGINPAYLDSTNRSPGIFRDGGVSSSMSDGFPTCEELNAMQAAEAEKADKVVR